MFHKPIHIHRLGLSFPHKTCFTDFSAQISPGSRIAIIGRNGSGKSSLLKILAGLAEPDDGDLHLPKDITAAYIPQIIDGDDPLSGGQRLNKAMTDALAKMPNMLLLDEPTNHLDTSNRKALMRMLRNYDGTLFVVSHDVELLRHSVDMLWHIDEGRVKIFHGNYDDYLRERQIALDSRIDRIATLERTQKKAKAAMQAEQERSAKSKRAGKNEKDKFELRKMRESGEESSGKIKSRLNHIEKEIRNELQDFRLPEIIRPKFSFSAAEAGARNLILISEGCLGYDEFFLFDIYLSVNAGQRVAIQGDNASGKSTVIKAILGDRTILKSGNWQLPEREHIGYLDQHYRTLDPRATVYETIGALRPEWVQTNIRQHLNDFMFRKNEEISAKTSSLSGGEKVRLCLAQIAAKTPRLLVLDEVTNNLDLETRGYVIQVLRDYPGALVVISHDADFLQEVGIEDVYEVKEGFLRQV